MNAIGGQEILFPALLPRAPVRDVEPVDRVRRRRVPAQGPPRQRLHARAHPRGVLHADGEGGVLVVQGLPAAAVPDPDEVPRRGAAPRGHPARPRVRDEGLVLVRRRRRRPQGRLSRAPRGLPEDLRPARRALRHRLGGVGRDGRQRVRGVPGRERDRRGHLRAVPGVRLRRQRRGRHHRRARRRCRSTGCPKPWCTTPATPRPSPPSSTGPTAPGSAGSSPPPTR